MGNKASSELNSQGKLNLKEQKETGRKNLSSRKEKRLKEKSEDKSKRKLQKKAKNICDQKNTSVTHDWSDGSDVSDRSDDANIDSGPDSWYHSVSEPSSRNSSIYFPASSGPGYYQHECWYQAYEEGCSDKSFSKSRSRNLYNIEPNKQKVGSTDRYPLGVPTQEAIVPIINHLKSDIPLEENKIILCNIDDGNLSTQGLLNYPEFIKEPITQSGCEISNVSLEYVCASGPKIKIKATTIPRAKLVSSSYGNIDSQSAPIEKKRKSTFNELQPIIPSICYSNDDDFGFDEKRKFISESKTGSVYYSADEGGSYVGSTYYSATSGSAFEDFDQRRSFEYTAHPKILLSPDSDKKISFNVDEAIRMKIPYSGIPQPNAIWTHNGIEIESSEKCRMDISEKFASLKIDGIDRSYQGQYSLTLFNSRGEENRIFFVNIKGRPDSPGKPSITDIIGQSVTLRWNPPADDGGSTVTNYIVEYFRTGWDVWLKALSSPIIWTQLSDLIVGSEYRFRIKAENGYGLSDSSPESKSVTIEKGTPIGSFEIDDQSQEGLTSSSKISSQDIESTVSSEASAIDPDILLIKTLITDLGISEESNNIMCQEDDFEICKDENKNRNVAIQDLGSSFEIEEYIGGYMDKVDAFRAKTIQDDTHMAVTKSFSSKEENCLADLNMSKSQMRREQPKSSDTRKILVPRNYRKPRFLENLRALLTEEGLVSFECKVVGYPTPLLQWYKDGEELKPGDVYQLSGTNSLGKYSCIAINCMGTVDSCAELNIDDIKLHLNEEERIDLLANNTPPKFIQGLRCKDLKIGDTARLFVQITTNVPYFVIWYRDEEEIKSNSGYVQSENLSGQHYLDLYSVALIDQAEWKCVAKNEFGHSISSASVKLLIPRQYMKPIFIEPLKATLSKEGTVNLECKVIGVPQPVLNWFKDGVLLKLGDIHKIISGEGGTCGLGTYTCEANNCMGSISSTAALLSYEEQDNEENVVQLPPLRFTKETSLKGSVVAEATVINVETNAFEGYISFINDGFDDLKTEPDFKDISALDTIKLVDKDTLESDIANIPENQSCYEEHLLSSNTTSIRANLVTELNEVYLLDNHLKNLSKHGINIFEDQAEIILESYSPENASVIVTDNIIEYSDGSQTSDLAPGHNNLSELDSDQSVLHGKNTNATSAYITDKNIAYCMISRNKNGPDTILGKKENIFEKKNYQQSSSDSQVPIITNELSIDSCQNTNCSLEGISNINDTVYCEENPYSIDSANYNLRFQRNIELQNLDPIDTNKTHQLDGSNIDGDIYKVSFQEDEPSLNRPYGHDIYSEEDITDRVHNKLHNLNHVKVTLIDDALRSKVQRNTISDQLHSLASVSKTFEIDISPVEHITIAEYSNVIETPELLRSTAHATQLLGNELHVAKNDSSKYCYEPIDTASSVLNNSSLFFKDSINLTISQNSNYQFYHNSETTADIFQNIGHDLVSTDNKQDINNEEQANLVNPFEIVENSPTGLCQNNKRAINYNDKLIHTDKLILIVLRSLTKQKNILIGMMNNFEQSAPIQTYLINKSQNVPTFMRKQIFIIGVELKIIEALQSLIESKYHMDFVTENVQQFIRSLNEGIQSKYEIDVEECPPQGTPHFIYNIKSNKFGDNFRFGVVRNLSPDEINEIKVKMISRREQILDVIQPDKLNSEENTQNDTELLSELESIECEIEEIVLAQVQIFVMQAVEVSIRANPLITRNEQKESTNFNLPVNEKTELLKEILVEQLLENKMNNLEDILIQGSLPQLKASSEREEQTISIKAKKLKSIAHVTIDDSILFGKNISHMVPEDHSILDDLSIEQLKSKSYELICKKRLILEQQQPITEEHAISSELIEVMTAILKADVQEGLTVQIAELHADPLSGPNIDIDAHEIQQTAFEESNKYSDNLVFKEIDIHNIVEACKLMGQLKAILQNHLSIFENSKSHENPFYSSLIQNGSVPDYLNHTEIEILINDIEKYENILEEGNIGNAEVQLLQKLYSNIKSMPIFSNNIFALKTSYKIESTEVDSIICPVITKRHFVKNSSDKLFNVFVSETEIAFAIIKKYEYILQDNLTKHISHIRSMEGNQSECHMGILIQKECTRKMIGILRNEMKIINKIVICGDLILKKAIAKTIDRSLSDSKLKLITDEPENVHQEDIGCVNQNTDKYKDVKIMVENIALLEISNSKENEYVEVETLPNENYNGKNIYDIISCMEEKRDLQNVEIQLEASKGILDEKTQQMQFSSKEIKWKGKCNLADINLKENQDISLINVIEKKRQILALHKKIRWERQKIAEDIAHSEDTVEVSYATEESINLENTLESLEEQLQLVIAAQKEIESTLSVASKNQLQKSDKCLEDIELDSLEIRTEVPIGHIEPYNQSFLSKNLPEVTSEQVLAEKRHDLENRMIEAAIRIKENKECLERECEIRLIESELENIIAMQNDIIIVKESPSDPNFDPILTTDILPKNDSHVCILKPNLNIIHEVIAEDSFDKNEENIKIANASNSALEDCNNQVHYICLLEHKNKKDKLRNEQENIMAQLEAMEQLDFTSSRSIEILEYSLQLKSKLENVEKELQAVIAAENGANILDKVNHRLEPNLIGNNDIKVEFKDLAEEKQYNPGLQTIISKKNSKHAVEDVISNTSVMYEVTIAEENKETKCENLLGKDQNVTIRGENLQLENRNIDKCKDKNVESLQEKYQRDTVEEQNIEQEHIEVEERGSTYDILQGKDGTVTIDVQKTKLVPMQLEKNNGKKCENLEEKDNIERQNVEVDHNKIGERRDTILKSFQGNEQAAAIEEHKVEQEVRNVEEAKDKRYEILQGKYQTVAIADKKVELEQKLREEMKDNNWDSLQEKDNVVAVDDKDEKTHVKNVVGGAVNNIESLQEKVQIVVMDEQKLELEHNKMKEWKDKICDSLQIKYQKDYIEKHKPVREHNNVEENEDKSRDRLQGSDQGFAMTEIESEHKKEEDEKYNKCEILQSKDVTVTFDGREEVKSWQIFERKDKRVDKAKPKIETERIVEANNKKVEVGKEKRCDSLQCIDLTAHLLIDIQKVELEPKQVQEMKINKYNKLQGKDQIDVIYEQMVEVEHKMVEDIKYTNYDILYKKDHVIAIEELVKLEQKEGEETNDKLYDCLGRNDLLVDIGEQKVKMEHRNREEKDEEFLIEKQKLKLEFEKKEDRKHKKCEHLGDKGQLVDFIKQVNIEDKVKLEENPVKKINEDQNKDIRRVEIFSDEIKGNTIKNLQNESVEFEKNALEETKHAIKDSIEAIQPSEQSFNKQNEVLDYKNIELKKEIESVPKLISQNTFSEKVEKRIAEKIRNNHPMLTEITILQEKGYGKNDCKSILEFQEQTVDYSEQISVKEDKMNNDNGNKIERKAANYNEKPEDKIEKELLTILQGNIDARIDLLEDIEIQPELHKNDLNDQNLAENGNNLQNNNLQSNLSTHVVECDEIKLNGQENLEKAKEFDSINYDKQIFHDSNNGNQLTSNCEIDKNISIKSKQELESHVNGITIGNKQIQIFKNDTDVEKNLIDKNANSGGTDNFQDIKEGNHSKDVRNNIMNSIKADKDEKFANKALIEKGLSEDSAMNMNYEIIQEHNVNFMNEENHCMDKAGVQFKKLRNDKEKHNYVQIEKNSNIIEDSYQNWITTTNSSDNNIQRIKYFRLSEDNKKGMENENVIESIKHYTNEGILLKYQNKDSQINSSNDFDDDNLSGTSYIVKTANVEKEGEECLQTKNLQISGKDEIKCKYSNIRLMENIGDTIQAEKLGKDIGNNELQIDINGKHTKSDKIFLEYNASGKEQCLKFPSFEVEKEDDVDVKEKQNSEHKQENIRAPEELKLKENLDSCEIVTLKKEICQFKDILINEALPINNNNEPQVIIHEMSIIEQHHEQMPSINLINKNEGDQPTEKKFEVDSDNKRRKVENVKQRENDVKEIRKNDITTLGFSNEVEYTNYELIGHLSLNDDVLKSKSKINDVVYNDSGEYTCSTLNRHDIASTACSLKLKGDESQKPRAPTFTTTLKAKQENFLPEHPDLPRFVTELCDQFVQEHGTLTLQVEVAGNPEPDGIWLFNGRTLPSSGKYRESIAGHTHTLTVFQIAKHDIGIYSCKLRNKLGSSYTLSEVSFGSPKLMRKYEKYYSFPKETIKTTTAPTFSHKPESLVSVFRGEEIILSCVIEGDPVPRVSWFKGIKDITYSGRSHSTVRDNRHTIIIRETEFHDSGTYTVEAKNIEGSSRAYCNIKVRERRQNRSCSSRVSEIKNSGPETETTRRTGRYTRDLPGLICMPKVTDVGYNWACIVWKRSEKTGGGPVIAYKVEAWILGEDARWQELGMSPIPSFDAYNLKTNKEYLFRVTPRNRYGWGEAVVTQRAAIVGRITEHPSFPKSLPNQVRCMPGGSIFLEAHVTGDPTPDIHWYKNGIYFDASRYPRFEVTMSEGTVNQVFGLVHRVSIQITDLQLEDEGRYEVEAVNTAGKITCGTKLLLTYNCSVLEAQEHINRSLEAISRLDDVSSMAPQFTMRLRDRRVQVDFPVRLTCQVLAVPKPAVKWMKAGVPLISDDCHTIWQENSHFHTLEISSASHEDAAVYSVIATNDFGQIMCKSRLVVDSGLKSYISPMYIQELQDVCVQEGQAICLQVLIEAYPIIGVVWHRDGHRIRPSRRTNLDLTTDGLSCLIIKCSDYLDGGIYTCTASNEMGRMESFCRVSVESSDPTWRIVPRTIKAPIFLRKPRSLIAEESSSVIIECEVAGDPPPSVKWLKDWFDSDILVDDIRFQPTGESPVYNLYIKNCRLEDSGAYAVVASNQHGESRAIISLRIHHQGLTSTEEECASESVMEYIPRIIKPLQDVKCCDSDTITLVTVIRAPKYSKIRWEKQGKVLKIGGDIATDWDGTHARLHIREVYPEDEGEYSCIVYNSHGKAVTSSTILVEMADDKENDLTVQMDHRPDLSRKTTPSRFSRSPSVNNFQREGSAHSWAEVGWREPSVAISNWRPLSRGSSPLLLGDRRPTDLYQRQKGRTLQRPKFYYIPHDRIVEEGDSVTFQCAIKGHPTPGTIWDKDSIKIIPGGRMKTDEKNEIRYLEISKVTQQDGGLYRVTIENNFGREQATARLDVIKASQHKYLGCVRSWNSTPHTTPKFMKTLSPTIIKGGAQLHLLAQFEGSPKPRVKWYRNGQLIPVCREYRQINYNLVTKLEVSKTNSTDAGKYTCILVNDVGTAGSSCQVVIEDFNDTPSIPPSFIRHVKDISANDGEQVTLSAEVKGHCADYLRREVVCIQTSDAFKDRYEQQEEVGKGRFGIVYKVSEKENGRKRAAKIIKCLKADDRTKVKDEIAIMNALRHPKLLQLLAAFERKKDFVMIMEYISGGELFERVVADDFSLTERDCILFIRQICEGVNYMHHNSIVHLDLKPENILCVTKTSHKIKLIDFGLARKLDPEKPCRVLFGTPEFVAPEIINYEPISFYSDMWSVGVICYVLLSGLSPFMGENDAETFANITRAAFDFDDDSFDAISEDAKNFINKLLDKRKEKRPSSVTCLEAGWLAQKEGSLRHVVLSMDRLKKFIIHRKWQKTGNAIRALGRMANLTNLRNSSPTRLAAQHEYRSPIPLSLSSSTIQANQSDLEKSNTEIIKNSTGIVNERSDSGISEWSECSTLPEDRYSRLTSSLTSLTQNGSNTHGHNGVLGTGKRADFSWQLSIDSAVEEEEQVGMSIFTARRNSSKDGHLAVKGISLNSLHKTHSRV